MRVNVEIGQSLPLHCTALGKVLLAFGDLQVPESLKSYTPYTILDKDELRQHLEIIRQQGYALDNEEFDLGVRCLAVPVFDFQGAVIAAVGISGPSLRMTQDNLPGLANVVQEIGKALSERITSTHD